MKRIISFIAPRRLDAVAVILLAFLAGLFWTAKSIDFLPPLTAIAQSDLHTAVAFATWSCLVCLAIGVAAGWRRGSFKISILLLGICIASTVACYYLLQWFEISKSELEFWYGSDDGPSLRRLQPPVSSVFVNMFWQIPLALLGGFLSVLAFRSSPKLFKKSVGERLNLNRQKILVIAACCLFVIAMGSRAMGALRLGTNDDTSVYLPILLLNLAVMAAAFVIVVILPSWILLVNENRIRQLLLAFVAVILIGLATWQAYFYAKTPGMGYEIAIEFGIGIIGGALFLLALFGLKRAPDSPPVSNRLASKYRWFPTIWTLLIFSCVVGIASVFWLFETAIVASDPLDIGTWHRARVAKKHLGPSGSKLSFKPFWQGINIWNFSDSVDPDVMQVFDEVNGGQFALLQNVQPHIDTGPIANVAMEFGIQDSKINQEQLADLLKNATGFVSFNNVDVIGESTSHIQSSGLAGLMIHCDQPGRISKLLDPLGNVPIGRVMISSKLNAEDFAAVANISKSTTVYLTKGMDMDVPLPAGNQSLKDITVYLDIADCDQLLDVIRQPIFLESDIRILLQNGATIDPELFWDVYFFTSGRLDSWVNTQVDAALNQFDFATASRQFHWGFGFNEQDEITELFLPASDHKQIMLEQDQLKTLSFDSSWFNGKKGGLAAVPTDFDHLSGLKNLERLYLSTSAPTNSLDFLTGMHSLKHLQICELMRPLKSETGFDDCPSLESLTMFGTPANQTLVELARLKNFKTFTIVDWQEEVTDPVAEKANLKKSLPNCEVRVVKFGDHLVDVPKSFSDHIANLKSKLRRKLLAIEK